MRALTHVSTNRFIYSSFRLYDSLVLYLLIGYRPLLIKRRALLVHICIDRKLLFIHPYTPLSIYFLAHPHMHTGGLFNFFSPLTGKPKAKVRVLSCMPVSTSASLSPCLCPRVLACIFIRAACPLHRGSSVLSLGIPVPVCLLTPRTAHSRVFPHRMC